MYLKIFSSISIGRALMENFVFSTLSEDEIISMINAMEPFKIDAGIFVKYPFYPMSNVNAYLY